ncbi:MAG: hypothetical protein HUU28_15835 [Planctomycetaceae bacterium]|jgi:hypothetical protein|nr:hypothetical protein [Planctomycetaceae bacterium]
MKAWDDAEREVDAELEFHVAEATDELVAAGVPREEARERALAQLGDIERWRAECLRARKGRKVMLVKLQWAAIAALVLSLGFLGLRWSRAHQAQVLEIASLRAELAAERTVRGELGLAEQTALVLHGRLAAAGLNPTVRRTYLDSLALPIQDGARQHWLERVREQQRARLSIGLTPDPVIELQTGERPLEPVSGDKPDDQR